MTTTAPAVPAVRTATMDDVPAVARVLSRALYGDPLFRWLFPDDNLRMAQSARACALMAGFGHVQSGHTTVAERHEGPGGPVVRGAALWTPPNTASEGTAFLLRSLPHWIRLVGLGRLPELARYLGELKAAAAEEPHWYLSLLGADPAVRGSGAGTRLLRSGLALADAEGVPVYLETMNPVNIAYYERYDFRVVRAVNLPTAPSAYCMLRPAAP